jgi:hypothetical protein
MTFREEEHPRREDGEFVIRGGWRGIARSMSPEQRTVVANHLDAMLSNPGHGATPDTVDQLRQLRKADVNRFIAHAARFLRFAGTVGASQPQAAHGPGAGTPLACSGLPTPRRLLEDCS